MDMARDSGFAGRLPVVETGRRRRWSVAEKLRIVEESLAGRCQASATARRRDISNPLLFKWRKAYREGRLSRPGVCSGTPARGVTLRGGRAGGAGELGGH